jgi:lycopene cyclase domain-containing protein
MSLLYLGGLVFAIGCLVLIDWRFKLAFFSDAKRTAVTLLVAIGLFVLWDVLGIQLGIFFHAGSPYTLPVRLLPEFPIEELFFLFLLTYVTLIIYQWVRKGSRA